jgi:hydroxymethylpyrimidine/phosphomethylpyrimidine kinase
MKNNVALSIAGFDPSGGAGVQADLKAFASLGLHGVTVVTCITIQNTQKVTDIYQIPVNIIKKQFDILIDNLKIEIVKTGMLYNSEIVNCISKRIKKHNLKAIVDPVIISTSGDTLSEKNFINSIKVDLLPYTFIITPNIYEAQVLSNTRIKTLEDVKKACIIIRKMGPQYVLIKGGHLSSYYAKDVFFNGKDYTIFSNPKIPDIIIHGSGCTFSSLIAGFLALGEKPINAIERSKNILWNMIYNSYSIGKGPNIVNASYNIAKESPYSFHNNECFNIWLELKESIESLISILPIDYVPEVGINFGYALVSAKNLTDICAIDGRIVKTLSGGVRSGNICFGASKHISSIILAVMSFNSDIRCALNFKYSEEIIKQCEKTGFTIASFNRAYEPSNISSTLDWGTKEVIKQLNYIPDIIYDKGALGKEPMIRFLGRNPKDLIEKIESLLKN